ncbi:MAG: DNA-protecting protein DprA [Gammaproteobacteria bacterium]|nr:DNA-protecting protein DprA [Gammaproteobacteria bacterium]
MDFNKRGLMPQNDLLAEGARNQRCDASQNAGVTHHWCRFLRDVRWTRKQKFELLSTFRCPSVVYQNPEPALRGVTNGRWNRRHEEQDKCRLDADLLWLTQPGRCLIGWGQPRYPSQLAEIPDPPLALFAEGNTSLLDEAALAVVGSRRPTPAGSRITQLIVQQLAGLGLVITSGMALGVDGLAHAAALQAGGSTVAVMGCGLDIVYPQRHRKLHGQIREQGLLLSPFALNVRPDKSTFPQRNRIVSGLSLGALIIEAAERSGTLITARLALEQNREVLVVPGNPLSPQYRGSNKLIREGAALVTSAEEVLEELAIPLRNALQDPPQEAAICTENPVLKAVGFDSTPVDLIIQHCGLTAAEVSSMLLMLELEGLVALADDGGYVRLA